MPSTSRVLRPTPDVKSGLAAPSPPFVVVAVLLGQRRLVGAALALAVVVGDAVRGSCQHAHELADRATWKLEGTRNTPATSSASRAGQSSRAAPGPEPPVRHDADRAAGGVAETAGVPHGHDVGDELSIWR